MLEKNVIDKNSDRSVKREWQKQAEQRRRVLKVIETLENRREEKRVIEILDNRREKG